MSEKQRFRVPVHPLGFSLTMACVLFERAGWEYTGIENDPLSNHLSYAVFEREPPPYAETYFQLDELYLSPHEQSIFHQFISKHFDRKANDASISTLTEQSLMRAEATHEDKSVIARAFGRLRRK